MKDRAGKWIAAALVAASAVSVAGCSRFGGNSAPAVTTESSHALPFESLSDWVSYADAVVAARVVGEKELAPEGEGPEQHTGRRITVAVDDVLWGDGAPGEQLDFFDLGMWGRPGSLRPMNPSDGPRIEVGGRYLMALIHVDGEWGPMTTGSVVPLVGDVLTPLPNRIAEPVKILAGKTLSEVRKVLAVTDPDPLAAQWADLDPIERYQRVAAARALDEPEPEPAPGEG